METFNSKGKIPLKDLKLHLFNLKIEFSLSFI